MMSKHRFTVEVLAAGQPRPYADTIHHTRVIFEHVPWDAKGGDFQPLYITEDRARSLLKEIPYANFIERTKQDAEWWETRLDWLKPIDPKLASELISFGDPKQTLASIWEFHTTTAFTD